jgi:hypothetical protein
MEDLLKRHRSGFRGPSVREEDDTLSTSCCDMVRKLLTWPVAVGIEEIIDMGSWYQARVEDISSDNPI